MCYVWQFPFCEHVMFIKIRENDSAHEFIPTKLAAVCLFHQYKIKWMIWSTRKQYYLVFWAFSQLKSVYIDQCIFNRNTFKWRIWPLRNASWVISIMAATRSRRPHNPKMHTFCANSLKEYDIIMFIYKIKTSRLDLLCFCAPQDIIL